METTTLGNSVLSSLRSLPPRATRYEPCRNDACVSWREPFQGRETESVDVIASPTAGSQPPRLFALLLDISQTGASVALDRVPEPQEGVWLRLEGEAITDWTEAEVVGVTTTTQGPHLVRLAFKTPCPFETLQAAVCG